MPNTNHRTTPPRATRDSSDRLLLSEGLSSLAGLSVDDHAIEQLLHYLAELERWNQAYNLTAVPNGAEMIRRHVLDSLSILPWLEPAAHAPTKNLSVLDAGSGAGLPGIPLALVRPELSLTLLDSAGKKVRFLRHIVRELSISNVEPVQQRLDRYRPDRTFDVIVSRALASLADFSHDALHLVAANTRILAMKGRYPHEELKGLPQEISVDTIEQLEVPGLKADRHLVIMSLIQNLHEEGTA